MRLIRFLNSSGVRVGVVDSVLSNAVMANDLTELIPPSIGPAPELLLTELALLKQLVGRAGDPVRVTFEELLPPVNSPGKFLCAAMNYHEHVAEMGVSEFRKARIVPKLFMKPPSSLLAPYGRLILPTVSNEVDWEIELAVVIGRGGRRISKNTALDHVSGYTVINDVSARSTHWGLESREPSHWDSFFDWLMGKWPDGFAPLGPWLVTADEVSDPQNLELRLSVNGTLRQSSSTAAMIFSIAELISFASDFMTLEPGDLLATGTPSGVGSASGTYLRAGDVMVGEIDQIGQIRTEVVAN